MATRGMRLPMIWTKRAPTVVAGGVITLGYGVVGLAVLAVFRHELLAMRASSVLLAAGVLAAAMMLGTDAYGQGVFKVFEFPFQVAAVALLLLAHLTRYLEVREGLPSASRSRARLGGSR